MVFVGLGFLVTVFVLGIPALGLTSVARTIKVVFTVLPNYAVAQVETQISKNNVHAHTQTQGF